MEKHSVKVKSMTPSLLEEIENLRSRIAKRAFELFTDRGGALGLNLDDWFLTLLRSKLLKQTTT